MFYKITLAAFLGLVALTFSSCAEAPKEEPAPVATETKPAEPEGPFYDLTKDELLTHPDWTSRNITFMGAKIGDKTKDIEKNFGALDATEPLGDHYRSIYEKVSYAVYTHKMTGELQKIEIYSKAADKVKDPKLRKLLSGGNLDYMREILGPEEGLDVNPNTTGSETIYDAKGFRFVKYELPGGIKFNALLFQKMPKKS
jgi:hypothetical protein